MPCVRNRLRRASRTGPFDATASLVPSLIRLLEKFQGQTGARNKKPRGPARDARGICQGPEELGRFSVTLYYEPLGSFAATLLNVALAFVPIA
jgi:hypothetical protein